MIDSIDLCVRHLSALPLEEARIEPRSSTPPHAHAEPELHRKALDFNAHLTTALREARVPIWTE